MTELESFRTEKDRFFATHPQSPLLPEQKRGFKGLHYFPENPVLRLEVAVEAFPRKEVIQMQTTTGGVQTYTRFGKFRFRVEEQEAELTLYAGPHGYFLPFADSLAGTETYGAGRYLEVEPPERLRARAGGRDAAVDGLVKVDLDVALTAVGGGTALRLVADIAVLGKLGTLGHSVIVRKGAEIVDRFAAAVRKELETFLEWARLVIRLRPHSGHRFRSRPAGAPQ